MEVLHGQAASVDCDLLSSSCKQHRSQEQLHQLHYEKEQSHAFHVKGVYKMQVTKTIKTQFYFNYFLMFFCAIYKCQKVIEEISPNS